jgi:hypothetical protein
MASVGDEGAPAARFPKNTGMRATASQRRSSGLQKDYRAVAHPTRRP